MVYREVHESFLIGATKALTVCFPTAVKGRYEKSVMPKRISVRGERCRCWVILTSWEDMKRV
jgi:hypothetical protein